MATKREGNEGEPGAFKKLRRSKRNKDHVQEDDDPAIDSIDYDGDDGVTGEEVEETLERGPENLEENSRARLSNAPENLEGSDVELKFQLKMLEFMESMNQELKRKKLSSVSVERRLQSRKFRFCWVILGEAVPISVEL
jgi:hypothetical protein